MTGGGLPMPRMEEPTPPPAGENNQRLYLCSDGQRACHSVTDSTSNLSGWRGAGHCGLPCFADDLSERSHFLKSLEDPALKSAV